jgi:hypothetical protein
VNFKKEQLSQRPYNLCFETFAAQFKILEMKVRVIVFPSKTRKKHYGSTPKNWAL